MHGAPGTCSKRRRWIVRRTCEAHPVSGRVYVVLTYNESRKPEQVDAANPRADNRFGHIIEIVPPLVNGKPDHAATECDWGFFLLAGNPNDPTHGAQYRNAVSATAGSQRRITSPSIRKDASGSRPTARTTMPASTTASTRRR